MFTRPIGQLEARVTAQPTAATTPNDAAAMLQGGQPAERAAGRWRYR